MNSAYDAIIVGARCAGAATAMLMARGGMNVLLVDWAEAGSDTMSTHALMRGATMQLARWGVLDRLIRAGTPEVTKTTFYYGDEVIPVEIRPAFGTRGLMAPRRHLLDRTLVSEAWASGADVRFKTAFRDVVRDETGRVIGAILQGPDGTTEEVRAGLVIGADGRRSAVARQVGARATKLAAQTTACVYQYFDGLIDDGYHWYYGPGVAAGAIPTNDGGHCVFVASDPQTLGAKIKDKGPEGALQAIARQANADLGQAVLEAEVISHPTTFRGELGYFRTSAGTGWALVGDAGYFKDPLTAHGITDALRDAEILSRAVLRGGDAALCYYEKARNMLSEDLFDITCEIARCDLSMEALKDAHVRLNTAMKAEQTWMAEAFSDQRLAA